VYAFLSIDETYLKDGQVARIFYKMKPAIRKLAMVDKLLPLLRDKWIFTEAEEEFLSVAESGSEEQVHM